MLGKVAHLWLQVRASGLQQDAVIEIMLAILGAMLGVLALLSAAFAAIVGVVGVFGYQTIRDEAKRRAEEVATKVATDTATRIAEETLAKMWAQIQAAGMSEGQAEPSSTLPALEASAARPEGPKQRRRRATSDENLRRGGDQ